MNILYISRARIPSPKAHVTQIHKMCDAFLHQGIELELIHPFRRNPFELPSSSAKEYYGLQNDIPVRTLPSLDVPFLKKFSISFWFWIYATTYVMNVLLYVLWLRVWEQNQFTIYSRDRISTLILLLLKPLLGVPMFFEMHDRPGSLDGIVRNLWYRLDGIVTISESLKEELKNASFPSNRITVEHDAVDLSQFTNLPSKRRLREQLQLPAENFIIGYTGHLYSWKGAELILELAEISPELLFVTVGGTPEDIATFRKKAKRQNLENLKILRHQPQKTIPRYLKSFDILLLPTSRRDDQPSNYTSPLKLFEYMASGRPIVASNLPSITEILTDDENALLARPDDPEDFRRQILRLQSDPDLAETLGCRAREQVKVFSWNRRAERILQFLGVSEPRSSVIPGNGS